MTHLQQHNHWEVGSTGEQPSVQGVIFRVKKDEVVSHVPIQATAIHYLSDERIKKDIVDVDDMKSFIDYNPLK